jgi:hypothetical protein
LGTNREQLLESDRLRVRFWLAEDRYAHEIWLAVAGEWMAVLASVEGSPSEDWPASPPFQSLHCAELGTANQSALLVGMAGKSHWSASIELDPAGDCARFDIACRVRGATAPGLSSTYRTMPGVSARQAHEGKLEFNAPSLVKVNMSLQLSSPQESPRASFEIVEGKVRIVANDLAAIDSSRTVRWRYTLRGVDSRTAPDR